MIPLPRSQHLELFPAGHAPALALPLATFGISCGFPSPADDYMEQSLDLNQILIKDKEATFFGRVKGDSMEDANIRHGDVLVIDRSLEAQNNSIALCMLNGEFTVKRLALKNGSITLHPANPQYKPIPITPELEFSVWGVVTYVIHKAR